MGKRLMQATVKSIISSRNDRISCNVTAVLFQRSSVLPGGAPACSSRFRQSSNKIYYRGNTIKKPSSDDKHVQRMTYHHDDGDIKETASSNLSECRRRRIWQRPLFGVTRACRPAAVKRPKSLLSRYRMKAEACDDGRQMRTDRPGADDARPGIPVNISWSDGERDLSWLR